MNSDDLPLSRALADRAAELRTRPHVLDEARADAATRVLLVADAQVLTGSDGALSLLTVADAVASRAHATSPPDDEAWLLLGRHEATTYLALRVPAGHPVPRRGEAADVLVHRAAGATAPEDDADGWTPLRQIGGDLSALDAGLATTAVALDAWHTRHPRCPRCGAATEVVQAGWVRRCVADGSEHYPRTDAAVIMAVVDESDRLLLGRAAAWAERRFSTLAGFVEPGESLEHAVRREVLEEASIVVGDVEYRGSQPWPFPASLMVGFVAHATSTDVQADGDELVDARWFTRDELAAAVRAGQVIPPGRSSIARALVDDWFGGPLPQSSGPSATWR
ncbi:NAD(+) diphosphatase [Cellulomonas sp. PhB150]|uniref:NAD(+) diphosphatase n=1 Tax=Cellulomonas sp. PhB150 TaxID=2485188 RepID=UPI000F493D01|nr:NAD(+) diphosphatase [Cellulomonas sp. PhB150]ROS31365.1 NAD+ diphosphatase [Cellulomonas sp. PhB150]